MAKVIRQARALAERLQAITAQAQRARLEIDGAGAAQRQVAQPLAFQEQALADRRAARGASERLRQLGLV